MSFQVFVFTVLTLLSLAPTVFVGSQSFSAPFTRTDATEPPTARHGILALSQGEVLATMSTDGSEIITLTPQGFTSTDSSRCMAGVAMALNPTSAMHYAAITTTLSGCVHALV